MKDILGKHSIFSFLFKICQRNGPQQTYVACAVCEASHISCREQRVAQRRHRSTPWPYNLKHIISGCPALVWPQPAPALSSCMLGSPGCQAFWKVSYRPEKRPACGFWITLWTEVCIIHCI